jgi:hypothetical protein
MSDFIYVKCCRFGCQKVKKLQVMRLICSIKDTKNTKNTTPITATAQEF